MGIFNKNKSEHVFTKPSDATIAQCFNRGNTLTKLSFFVFGLGNILNKQIVRGLVFLAIEVAYIVYMVTFGFGTLVGLTTLGTNQQQEIYNEVLGIYQYTDGDNSMLFLLFGVITLMLSAAVVFFACNYSFLYSSSYFCCINVRKECICNSVS